MSGIEQWRLEEKIKIASLRHRGNAIAVAKELNIDLEYARKMVNKLRKRDEKDVTHKIASTLMAYLFAGHDSRKQFINEMLLSLDNRHQITVSVCCSANLGKIENSNMCLKCHKPCEVMILDQQGIYTLKQQLLEQDRKEDLALIEFAEKMGYTEQRDDAVVKYEDKRQYVVMGQGNQEMIQELKKLTPLERNAIRLKIESEALGHGQEETTHPSGTSGQNSTPEK